MRIVFFATPDFAVPSLEALLAAGHSVAVVVTQADRPRGRGLASAPSPVKAVALAHGLAVETPERLRGFAATLTGSRPDVVVVVAYGKILPGDLLALGAHGAVNVHASLLPRHRGASPIQHAILAGDSESGVTTMQMDAGLDTGAILLQEATPIREDDDSVSLAHRLAEMGANLLVATLRGLAAGTLTPRPQPPAGATYAPRLASADARIDWRRPAAELARRVRAFQPWPGVEARLADGRALKIVRALALADPAAGEPGLVLGLGPHGLEIACGEGRLAIQSAKPAGRSEQSARDLVNGRQIAIGERLGP